MDGTLIILEGGEGVGKTTQCHLLTDWLSGLGVSTTYVSELRGTAECQALAAPALDASLVLDPLAETLGISAARRQAYSLISEKLRQGYVVVSDRGPVSSVVYQAVLGGVDRDVVDSLNELATGGLKPALTVLIDCPVEFSSARRRMRSGLVDKFEAKELDYHERVRSAFLELASSHGLVIVDGQRSVDVVAAEIRNIVSSLIDVPLDEPPGHA